MDKEARRREFTNGISNIILILAAIRDSPTRDIDGHMKRLDKLVEWLPNIKRWLLYLSNTENKK